MMPLPKFLYKLFGGKLEQQGSSESLQEWQTRLISEGKVYWPATTYTSNQPLYDRMVAAVEAEKGKDLCGLNAAQRSARTAAGNRTRREKRIALQREVTARLREGL